MGLDMYLYLEDKETKETIEYSYYRKFNALQGYFVDRFDIQNKGRVDLTKETISDMAGILEEIYRTPEKGVDLLPTFSGPFFGSYDYDHIYYSDVKKAMEDFYHAQFIDFNVYTLYFTSNW